MTNGYILSVKFYKNGIPGNRTQRNMFESGSVTKGVFGSSSW